MANHRSPKRQRLPCVHEDEEEDDENHNGTSGEEEEADGSDSARIEEGEVETSAVVGGMRTFGDDYEDMVTAAQSVIFLDSSFASSSSSQQSLMLKSSEVLDCPNCCEPLKRPIYQCINGHIACSSCCTKLWERCPFCKSDIGDIRCRAMERIIEATIVPCRNAIYGCNQTTTYGNQTSHEKLCVFTRCSCPLPNCNYTGSYTDLKSHARAEHTHAGLPDEDKLTPIVLGRPLLFYLNLNKNKMAIFQEEKEGDLIVVQAFKGSAGVYVSVFCIAPMAPEIRKFSCYRARLKVKASTSLKQRLQVKKIPKMSEEEEPKDGFVLIPNYMLDDENLMMRICIGSEYKYIHI